MLPEKELEQIKQELDECKDPLFIYDDDTDGLCAFLLLYKYKREGVGVARKSKAVVSEELLGKVIEHNPDKIFILDIPNITEEFLEGVSVPIVQVDHHPVTKKIHGVKTFNPTTHDKNDSSPTSTICYNVVKQDLWLCAVGTIGDWHLTEETEKFGKENPDLLDASITDPGKALFESKIGFLSRIINLLLKSSTTEIKRAIAHLIKIKDPREILDETTEDGKTLHKKFEKNYAEYLALYNSVEKKLPKEKLFVFKYPSGDLSLTTDLSNELTYRHPDKVIVVAREKSGEMKCSIRSGTMNIRDKLLKALEGFEGNGGGHEKACGAMVKAKDFDMFIEKFRELVEQ